MNETPVVLDGASLSLRDLVEVARNGRGVDLDSGARTRMHRSFGWVTEACQSDEPIYGVNTGFGSLARVRIDPALSAKLSANLVRSHAAGVGRPLGDDVVRGMILLRANALARGVSGCQPRLVEILLAMLNAGVTPVVPSQGSCGSSGDLAPLSHLGLVIAGMPEGEARFEGQVMPADQAMRAAGIVPLTLGAKDGLAITNGAQATTSLLALACHDAAVLMEAAEVAAAMSIEALLGASRAFHSAVHAQRPYRGALATASHLRALMADSTLVDSVPAKVQDAYSLRCTPTVLGAARDALDHVVQQLSVELNATTDNPLILVDEPGQNKAYSAGLFHGEPLGLVSDYLKIAVGEVASISERRLYRLTTGSLSARLPAGLAREDRPDLGWMVPQTTAAALVSEIRALGWPASLDSIPTCEDQEDHVAMSTTAARRLLRVVACARKVVAIELLVATEALAMRDGTGQLGRGTREAYAVLSSVDLGDLPSDQIATIDQLISADALGRRMRDVGIHGGVMP